MPPICENFQMEKMDVQLLQAAREGDLPKVIAILCQSKDVLNCINEHGQTPIYIASRYYQFILLISRVVLMC